MPTFKFDSQTAFLTYAQCDAEINALVDFLNGVKPLEWARVCRERHEDGNWHLHAVCKWESRVQSRNQAFLDYNGKHPNIQPIRSIKRALEYVAKDGQFRDIGPVPQSSTNIDWMAAAETMSECEYYKLACKERLPFQYAQKFWQLGCKQSCEITDDYIADLSRERIDLNLAALPQGTTVLVGPSGIGKTSWAKRVCPKPALWVRHIDVLRSFRKGYHKSIIFDDMSFRHMPREAQIHIVDQTDEAHVHCRYGHAVIPSNTTKIFTANEMPFLDDPAILRRINLLHL